MVARTAHVRLVPTRTMFEYRLHGLHVVVGFSGQRRWRIAPGMGLAYGAAAARLFARDRVGHGVCELTMAAGNPGKPFDPVRSGSIHRERK